MHKLTPPPPPLARRLTWLLLLLLAMPWAASSVRGQQGPAAFGPPSSLVPLYVNVSATNICEGGRAVLSASGGYYAGNAVTYAWTPGTDITATTGSTVVVGPLQNTTYIVTATSSYNGNPLVSSYSVSISVSANCCEQSVSPYGIVELTSTLYNTNPFTGPPGTRYHATGSLTLRGNVTYKLPVGGQLLLDAFATLTLTEHAVLELPGASISASCDSMWNQVRVMPDAGGVRTSVAGTLPAFVGHAYGGIRWDEPAIPAATPFFQLNGTTFRENRQSMELHRLSPSSKTDYVRYCTFSSTPSKFKGRFRTRGVSDYYYSLRHLAFDGTLTASEVSHNKFVNAMFGVYSGQGNGLNATFSSATLQTNTYSNIWLAGVYAGDGQGDMVVGGSSFDYPTAAALPPTPQLTQAVSNDLNYVAAATYGVFSYNPNLAVDHTTFEQSSTSSYATYNYPLYRTSQTGIYGRNVKSAVENTFYSLQIGLRTEMGGTTGAGNSANTKILGNLFQECVYGCQLQGGTLTAPYAVVHPFVSCNTFQVLHTKTSSGYSYCIGIYIIPGSWVELLDTNAANPQTAPLKNLFVDDPGQNGNQMAIDNPSNYQLSYITFDFYQSAYSAYVLGNTNILPSGTNANSSNNCASDHLPDTGIQMRSTSGPKPSTAQADNFLTESFPNPASEQTTFNYRCHINGRPAQCQLIIHALLNGREVQRVPLPTPSGQYTLDLRDLPSGLYVAALVVDGIPQQYRRFAVSE